MTVDIPADLAPFVQRLIAKRRFLTEGDVLAEGLRLLQSQEADHGDLLLKASLV
jgi:antitoxin ParD1/3/4